MEVRVLGCSGGIGGNDMRTTSLLVDTDILIDCGTGLGRLELEKLPLINHIFLTHAHLDHVALLPLLIDTVFDMRDEPITLYALEETIQALRQHIFNWTVWPDFNAIPNKDKPILRFQPIKVGEGVTLNGRTLTAMPALHSIPAVGYCLSKQENHLVFSGDTTFSDEVIAAINAIEGLQYLIMETAFPEKQKGLAVAASHMCPSMLYELLNKLTGDPQIFITHLKPSYIDLLSQEILSYRGRLQPKILESQQVIKV